MAELRYNPLLRDWTMVAAIRQFRPQMPQNDCPFCPGSGKVPDKYDVYAYDNDYPVLSQQPPEPEEVATGIYQAAPAYGKCEVILYSSDHTAALPDLSVNHILKLIDLWVERFCVMEKDKKHKYVFVFENRGAEVGVTMPHPHGQIYAYPYIPLKIRQELESCQAHFKSSGNCLLCDMNAEERSFSKRVIYETNHFISYLPFFTDYPYGAFVSAKTHKTCLVDLTRAERLDLAQMLKTIVSGMDALFDREFPYMMAIHQRPVNSDSVEEFYHLHIEFYPPLWSRTKMKYLASSETGAWAPANPMAIEVTAGHLRDAIARVERGEAHAR